MDLEVYSVPLYAILDRKIFYEGQCSFFKVYSSKMFLLRSYFFSIKHSYLVIPKISPDVNNYL